MPEPFGPKSGFLGMVSHEIRSTLNDISGVNNLMLETALSPEQRRYIETIQSSSETLLSLMNALVDFSIIETGEFKLDEIEFDLRTAIDEAMEAVASQAHEKGIEIHTLIHASVPETVRGDPARLRQIIANLAGNAVQVSRSGEFVLTVKTISDEPDRAVVRFTIAGFGCTVDEGRMQPLFQPFSQPDFISSWKFGKTGLELALSKRFAQLMGGNIGISNIAKKGPTFWFSAELMKCPPAVRTPDEPVPSLSGMNVIVIDSSVPGRRTMAQYLESAGCRCREFDCCENFLRKITNGKTAAEEYDAMIVALKQVGGAEYDSLAQARSREEMQSIPLVLVTAIGRRGDVLKLGEIGAAAYLTRPLRHNQLIACMRTIRGGAQAAPLKSDAPAPASSRQMRLITRHTIAEGKTNKKIRILVADDNASNRKTVKKFLDEAGYVCDVAENGVDALDSFGRKGYDLVFMDCHMPIMNGYDATSTLRQAEARHAGAHVPVCAMASAASAGDAEKCFAAGMDDVIMKPFNRADFLAMVEKWERKISTPEQGKGARWASNPVRRGDATAPATDARGG
jgi:two-component system, sensor histidine kinase and response regulator